MCKLSLWRSLLSFQLLVQFIHHFQSHILHLLQILRIVDVRETHLLLFVEA